MCLPEQLATDDSPLATATTNSGSKQSHRQYASRSDAGDEAEWAARPGVNG